MSLVEILKIIGTDGLPLLISAGVLYFLFKIANLFYTKFENKMQVEKHSKDLKQKRPQTIERNNLIQQILYKAMYEYGAGRAYIFEYHNGGHSISGIAFMKASNTFEVCTPTVQPQQITLQNLPVGVFAYWNMKVLNKEVIAKNVDDIQKEDMGAYQVLKQNGVKGVYIIGLYDAKGYAIGFFGIDFIAKDLPEFTDDMHRSLERLSLQISGLLY